MTRSISTVSVELSGGKFTLLADNSALAELEEVFDASWFKLVSRFGAGMRIKDLCKVTAALARASHPDITAAAVLAAMPTMEDYKEALRGCDAAISAALPPKKTGTEVEDGSKATEDPH